MHCDKWEELECCAALQNKHLRDSPGEESQQASNKHLTVQGIGAWPDCQLTCKIHAANVKCILMYLPVITSVNEFLLPILMELAPSGWMLPLCSKIIVRFHGGKHCNHILTLKNVMHKLGQMLFCVETNTRNIILEFVTICPRSSFTILQCSEITLQVYM